mgnify:CR=1 FL=1
MTPVADIFARFAVLVEDSKYNKLSDEEIEFILNKYLESAVVLFKELNKKYKPMLKANDYGEMFLVKTINDDGEAFDMEEQQILAYGMVIAWHESKIYRDKFLKQNINTKDFQQLSNATMLMNNRELYEISKKEFVKRRRRYRNRDWNGDDL